MSDGEGAWVAEVEGDGDFQDGVPDQDELMNTGEMSEGEWEAEFGDDEEQEVYEEEIDEDELLEQMDAMQDPLEVCREIVDPRRMPPNALLDAPTAQLLYDRGYAVIDNFLDADLAEQLAGQALELDGSGLLRAPHAARDAAQFNLDEDARNDVTMWVHAGEYAGTPLGAAIARLTELRSVLSTFVAFHPDNLAEVQLALYKGGGGRYVRHRDALPAGLAVENDEYKPRRVTAILYTVADWQDSMGGELRVFRNRADKEGIAQIAPVAGRLVVFLSGAMDHEVMPAFVPRVALTAWFH